MSNRQIQPVRSRDYALGRPMRPRSLWGQVWTVALQPAYFFRTMPSAQDSRQWFWVAGLILALIAISAVRQEALKADNGAPPASAIPDFGGFGDPGLSGGGEGSPFGGGGSGGIPGDLGIPPAGPAAPASSGDIADTWTTALISAVTIIIGWLVLSVMLSEVSLFNGRRPELGTNLQIAIWSSVPLAIMAGLQLIYYAAGGAVGESGIAGLLAHWKAYEEMPAFSQNVLLSLTSRLTIFWLWSLVLLYIAARQALNGKRWAVMIVVIAWAVVLVVVPVITGAVNAQPESEAEAGSINDSPFGQSPESLFGGEVPPGLEFLTGGTPEVTGEPGFEATDEAAGEFNPFAQGEATAEAELQESGQIQDVAVPAERPPVGPVQPTLIPGPGG